MAQHRRVFFISDRTGLTVEALGSSLLTQFAGVEFQRITLPFIDTIPKAIAAVAQVNQTEDEVGQRALVFSSIVDDAVREEINKCHGLVLDVFERFIIPLEGELGEKSTHVVGKSHSAGNSKDYNHRIEAINYTLSHDDGVTNRELEEADIILVGVSRSGKTPTCLYMAMQFGIKAANYPLIPEDLEANRLPPALLAHKHKVWGLSIAPERLHQIRSERRPDSKYAALENCRYEVAAAEKLMKRNDIIFLDSTTKSIEEIATHVLHEAHLMRRVY
ncbi:Phosphoenolpyruvate synthase regulatory protein [Usitatibacter rugosus]|uniref:Putative phosphoenolpyruvate synthase regulatory protein n=1 Tax=Usitatibacter rugosus TaxID=2732067 RepID=A0A6M4GT21_9PROT|nr:pyruvate, water dikinase regulatory protein [Usitatibacter rugosus]QJR09998.1 Phosphoenolpyruvate synthase regulatory protein [Usitatibacter rugosus]